MIVSAAQRNVVRKSVISSGYRPDGIRTSRFFFYGPVVSRIEWPAMTQHCSCERTVPILYIQYGSVLAIAGQWGISRW